MRNNCYDILHNFFHNSISFFTKKVPLLETQFKSEFRRAHSDWIDIRRSDIATFPIKTSLAKSLIELFDKAEIYFYLVIGSEHSYEMATQIHRNKWSDLQNLAQAIQKEWP